MLQKEMDCQRHTMSTWDTSVRHLVGKEADMGREALMRGERHLLLFCISMVWYVVLTRSISGPHNRTFRPAMVGDCRDVE